MDVVAAFAPAASMAAAVPAAALASETAAPSITAAALAAAAPMITAAAVPAASASGTRSGVPIAGVPSLFGGLSNPAAVPAAVLTQPNGAVPAAAATAAAAGTAITPASHGKRRGWPKGKPRLPKGQNLPHHQTHPTHALTSDAEAEQATDDAKEEGSDAAPGDVVLRSRSAPFATPTSTLQAKLGIPDSLPALSAIPISMQGSSPLWHAQNQFGFTAS